MIAIRRYAPELRAAWDAFAAGAKNGHFFFQRDYLEYHADRFADHSLLFYHADKLIALLPANRVDGRLVSHGGLTFGGVLSDASMTVPRMLELFESLRDYLRGEGIAQLLYKAIPAIYHAYPAEEDRYALFRHDAQLVRRDVSSTIYLPEALPLQDRRKRGAKKAVAQGVVCGPSERWDAYWQLLTENLQATHGVAPVHSLAEMLLLRSRFPQHIFLYLAEKEGEALSGVVVYENRSTAHAQYISANGPGKQLGALDALFRWLIEERYRSFRWFDFGTSTERAGRELNAGLIEQKEGFGARAIVHDFYEWAIPD